MSLHSRRRRRIAITLLIVLALLFQGAFAVGAGSEVQRPLATVVVSATVLTLLVQPALYRLAHRCLR